mgnify:CR=1 FL=1
MKKQMNMKGMNKMRITTNRLMKFLTKSQEDMWHTIYSHSYNTSKYNKFSNLGNFIYYKLNSDEVRPLLVCHLDTCNDGGVLPTDLQLIDNIISLKETQPYVCLGGDDRVGVTILLTLLEENFNCDFLFTCNEEIGGVGAKAFAESVHTEANNWSYVLEIDRKGINHIASYGYDNDELTQLIGLPVERGSYTDLVDICEASGVAGYNLACGYDKQHTTKETINLLEVDTCVSQIVCMLENPSFKKVFDNNFVGYKMSKYTNYDFNRYDYDDVEFCSWCGEFRDKEELNELTICKTCMVEDEKYIKDYYGIS